MSEFIPLKKLVDPLDRNVEEGVLSRCIMHCLGDLPVKSPAFLDEIREKDGIEVFLTINGREVSLKHFLDAFERQYSQIVAKHAVKLLDERLGKFFDFAGEFERAAREKFRETFGRDLGDFE